MVTYSRVLLAFWAAAVSTSQPAVAVALWLVNFVLDGVDGALARRLGQTSAFGAFLDVAVDIASRGLLWLGWAAGAAADAAAAAAAGAAPAGTAAIVAALALPLSLAVVLLECLVFTCTHAAAGAAWKQESQFAAAPAWVAAVMARGFKTPPGCLAIAGLMGCPLWLWASRALPAGPWSHPLLGAVLGAGRLLAAGVELWLVGSYLAALLRSDVRGMEARRQQQEAVAAKEAVAAEEAVVQAVAVEEAEEREGEAVAGGVAAVVAAVDEEADEDEGARGVGGAAPVGPPSAMGGSGGAAAPVRRGGKRQPQTLAPAGPEGDDRGDADDANRQLGQLGQLGR
ncbi:hypothetical protein HXX76_006423 [Chlamydomonas incerta]|uniref:CDP-diacylglycerol--inositol 3-phosphatidyltransferase n=1 Tax=Chlamydomonas incerta TaxID=51695 RepID=A0A835W4L7_CHLIN|nr:hypothetical protein HXX76_006423 [Chlamydomonas incerta]|eukprot:KAG2436904.1 hypothetical protein HXX76_006423 [Chlamydomonas incerta]